MSYKNILPLLAVFILFFVACSDDNEVDQEKPVINISFVEAFPIQCDTLFFGESFVLKMKFSDNQELGAFSIDIHHNFDHHSHSTEIGECSPHPDKVPVNPYLFINDYPIPEGLTEYDTNLTISIPDGNGMELYEEGDYHFMIKLTDETGWETLKGLSIKMVRR